MITKNIAVKTQFTNGSSIVSMIPVDKSKYTSLQSKACTYRTSLQGGIFTKKYTAEQATEMWQKNVVAKWNDLVEPQIKNLLPEEVLNCVESFGPDSNLLEFSADAQ